jgi:hypothetical protein
MRGGVNLYGYCGNNVLSFSDPQGLKYPAEPNVPIPPGQDWDNMARDKEQAKEELQAIYSTLTSCHTVCSLVSFPVTMAAFRVGGTPGAAASYPARGLLCWIACDLVGPICKSKPPKDSVNPPLDNNYNTPYPPAYK